MLVTTMMIPRSHALSALLVLSVQVTHQLLPVLLVVILKLVQKHALYALSAFMLTVLGQRHALHVLLALSLTKQVKAAV